MDAREVFRLLRATEDGTFKVGVMPVAAEWTSDEAWRRAHELEREWREEETDDGNT